jgi:peptidoglycan/LPS O-acetylase OafA/YrhL
MIQRIQTIYYLLALLSTGLSYFLPQITTQPDIVTLREVVFSPFLVGLMAGVTLANIFNFKRRGAQLAIGRAVVIIAFLTFSYFAYIHFASGGEFPGYSLIMPLLVVVFTSLGNKGVKRDEELIRGADRLR